MELMISFAAVLTTLLVIGGGQQNPGPVENIVQSCLVAATGT